MTDNQDVAKKIGDIERKISDGEALLAKTGRTSSVGWTLVIIGLLVAIFLGDFFLIVGVIVMAIGAWRIIAAPKYRKEIEEGLREYRGRKAELQARLMSKE